MHILYAEESPEFWIGFYKLTIAEQAQYHLGGGNLPGFRAYSAFQRGAGLGSFFKGLFRAALPLFKSAGKQAVVAGSSIATDLLNGRNLKDSVKEHGKTAASTLVRETVNTLNEKLSNQDGKGLGNRQTKKNVQAIKRRAPHRKRSFRKKQTRKAVGSDIFSQF